MSGFVDDDWNVAAAGNQVPAAGLNATGAPMAVGHPVAAAAPNQTTLTSRLLALPLHIREAIYTEVLKVENTIKHHVHRDWEIADIMDDMANSDIPTDWVWSMSPRITTYNFDTSLLLVNRQVYLEASRVWGRQNTWVLIRLGDALLIRVMQESGCAIPIPDTWTLAGLGDTSGKMQRIAVDITVGGTANRYAAQQKMFIMSVEGVWDLVAHLVSYSITPWCIVVRYNKADIFPASYRRKLAKRVRELFEPLRIIGPNDQRRGVILITENDESNERSDRAADPSIHIPLTTCEVLKLLRDYLPPFNADVDKVDWVHEEVKMAEWSFLFTNAITKYGVSEEFGPGWRDTLCMAHARMMAIRLGLGDLEQAEYHARRTDDMLEMHEARIWWYHAVVSNMRTWGDTLSKSVTQEILDVIWCLSHSEDKQWFNLFWLNGKEDEESERKVVLTAAHKIEAARWVASVEHPGDHGERARRFSQFMAVQGQKLVAGFSPGAVDEYNLSMRALVVANRLPDSFQSFCHQHGFKYWSLVEVVDIDVKLR
ncbi:uncharacterized protein GIQ15_02683 [Arthroderma uncinatum]|uniref:uncharacterized protein n=1 Tax=Arthroderma uncinatum TaxID=74035 RepID=UPI00144A9DD6|nr:uncharacterized protein GIQ15_02683 [Arthroderma uncinatum]KAF3483359.1 hypothetical protein GIQ15_02683 [Arthroderma uncinatum]